MSCDHLDLNAESNVYFEGQLICMSCGLQLRQGQLISEAAPIWTESHQSPLVSASYDRSLFFLRHLRRRHGADLTQEEMYEATRVYREFASCFTGKIAPHVKRKYILSNAFLAHRILSDVLGKSVPEDLKCVIKTPRIRTNFNLWWDFFLDQRSDDVF
jgi:hypothetical protein